MPTLRSEDRPATPRQLQVLAYIRRFLRQHARPPTLRRVAAEVGLSSPYSIVGILNALVRKGMLKREGGRGEWCAYLPVVPPGHCPCCEQPLPREGRP